MKKIMKEVREIAREAGRKKYNPNYPPWSGIAFTSLEGKPSKRLMLVFLAKGCEWAKTGGPCTMCCYWIQSLNSVTAKQLITQFRNGIKKYKLEEEKIEELNLFNAGSFLNDKEIPKKARLEIIKEAAKLKPIKKVLIETRPEYVNREKIRELKDILGKKILEVGIGLESSNDFTRNTCINKGVSLESFEKAVKILKEEGANLLVYILLKPPFLTEKEAIEGAIKSIKYVFRLGRKIGIKTKVAFEPVIVKFPSLVYLAWEKGFYSRTKLWSIIEVLNQVYKLGNIQVGVSPEGMEWYEMPSNCEKCTPKVVKAIEKFNASQDINVFRGLDCNCKKIWKKELKKKEIPIKKRIERFVKEYEKKKIM